MTATAGKDFLLSTSSLIQFDPGIFSLIQTLYNMLFKLKETLSFIHELYSQHENNCCIMAFRHRFVTESLCYELVEMVNISFKVASILQIKMYCHISLSETLYG